MSSPFVRLGLASAACVCWCVTADAQVLYYSAMRPVVAAPVVAAPAYVANYTPAGNYAAVTAFSPPVIAEAPAVAVTSYYAPVAVTSYYAPATVYSPVVAAPVTTYYAPAAVAVPVYRRGPFGGLRPVRSAYYISY